MLGPVLRLLFRIALVLTVSGVLPASGADVSAGRDGAASVARVRRPVQGVPVLVALRAGRDTTRDASARGKHVASAPPDVARVWVSDDVTPHVTVAASDAHPLQRSTGASPRAPPFLI